MGSRFFAMGKASSGTGRRPSTTDGRFIPMRERSLHIVFLRN